MNVPRQHGEKALVAIMSRHVERCGVPLRGEAPDLVEGERVYSLVCPVCHKTVAHLVLEIPERHT